MGFDPGTKRKIQPAEPAQKRLKLDRRLFRNERNAEGRPVYGNLHLVQASPLCQSQQFILSECRTDGNRAIVERDTPPAEEITRRRQKKIRKKMPFEIADQ